MLSLRLNQVVYEWDGHMGDLRSNPEYYNVIHKVNKCKKKWFFYFLLHFQFFN